jgi:hypothetical protein
VGVVEGAKLGEEGVFVLAVLTHARLLAPRAFDDRIVGDALQQVIAPTAGKWCQSSSFDSFVHR